MEDFQWNWGAGPVKDDEFRWNWAKANVDPSYKIQGPGIGSLLRAIHPDTQADAIQQMNNNLATDRANIETIAKQGAAENDFVNKLYEEQAAAERTANAAQGHKNAAMDLAMKALATGDEGQINAARYNLEQQYGKEYADQIMNEASNNVSLSKTQFENYVKLNGKIKDIMNTNDKEQLLQTIMSELDNKKITAKQAETLMANLAGKYNPDTESSKANIQNKTNRGIQKKNTKEDVADATAKLGKARRITR